VNSSSDVSENGIDDAATGWQEIAGLLGCSVRTAQRWAKAGKFSVYKVPGTKPLRVCARKSEVGTWRERYRLAWCTALGPGFTQKAPTGAMKDDSYVWGWKAIARRLNLSVSTVQLWEDKARLPVHRFKTGRRAFPYVLEGEISAWIKEGTVNPQTAPKVDRRLPLLIRSVLDAWPAHIAVLDATGTIIAVNKAWRAFSRSKGCWTPNFGIGSKYIDICSSALRVDAATASRLAAGLGEVLADQRPDLKVKYRCDSPTGRRAYLMSAMRLEGLTSRFLLLSHADVTDLL